jgi:hypothetical protein
MDNAGHPWAVPVAVEEIPDSGLHLEIEASPEIRTALAKLAEVRDIAQASAAFDLVRADGGVDVSGRVKARVVQTCVVTLEPVENEVDEPVDVAFRPGAELAAVPVHGSQVLDEDEEPPEPLIGGKVDLGALATEFLILGIDPYPRKPGAEFAPPKPAEAGEHPFAGLEALKKRLGGGES